ncbi:MAG: hypothetical protein K2L08_01675 [Erysipelotrichaceae bacterium]|nr:hypothetical protein [Erysipelotrichaceae bacterium]
MDRKKHYKKQQVQQDLYQYEMGIELGADVEADKQYHRKRYDDHACHDVKKKYQHNYQTEMAKDDSFQNNKRNHNQQQQIMHNKNQFKR